MHIIEVHHPAIPNSYCEAHPIKRGVYRISCGPDSARHWRNIVAEYAPQLVVHVYH